MPFVVKEYHESKENFTVKVVVLCSSNTATAYARVIFVKSGIFNGVKLISDTQRHSINHSETNFECQIVNCIF